jgi:Tfp pilus assembly pilus retraction ATPase PilT
MQTNKQVGMQTLEQHLQWLVQQNIISADTAQLAMS